MEKMERGKVDHPEPSRSKNIPVTEELIKKKLDEFIKLLDNALKDNTKEK